VNAEQVLGPTPALEGHYKREWLHKVRALDATEQQISDSLFGSRKIAVLLSGTRWPGCVLRAFATLTAGSRRVGSRLSPAQSQIWRRPGSVTSWAPSEAGELTHSMNWLTAETALRMIGTQSTAWKKRSAVTKHLEYES
jgi:hypothetical protein